MQRYSARKMIQATPEYLNEVLSGRFILVFDDGELEVSAHPTVFSSYVWEFHRRYPKTPMLMKHHAQSLTEKDPYNKGTPIKLLSNAAWSTFDAYRGTDEAMTSDTISALIYKVSNMMYNGLIILTEPYVVTLDILDFIRIMEHEKVKPVLENVSESVTYIHDCYSAIRTAIKNEPDLRENALAYASRAKVIREAQLLQCLGPRGYTTDIDSHFFSKMIPRSYAQGMRTFYNIITDSRGAAKSVGSNKVLIGDAEYFSRRLQLLCQAVETIHRGDCGTKRYLSWRIRGPEHDDEGVKVRPSDLEVLEGKYFLDESTGKLKVLHSTDKQYLGKLLKLRSPIAGCIHPNEAGICATCFGEMALNIPSGTNIGHLASSDMARQASQNILSTKHYLSGVSLTGTITVPAEYRQFIEISSNGNGYTLNATLKSSDVYLKIPPYMAQGLVDIKEDIDLDEIGLSHISEITSFGIAVNDKDGNEIARELVPIAVDRRKASFTYPMLHHIRRTGWGFDEKGNYVISMKGWNYKQSVFALPMRQYSMSDHAQAIAEMIESNKTRLKDRLDNESPQDMLVGMTDLVNSKLNVNIAFLEIILLASMIRSKEKEDYRFPKGTDYKEPSIASMTIAGRSLSAVLGYDDMVANIVDVAALRNEYRPQLPMDVLIKPQETLNDPYRWDKYYSDVPQQG